MPGHCGSADSQPADAVMSGSPPEAEHREFVAHVEFLANQMLTGHEVSDRVLAEHTLRVLEAASQILAQHPVDALGRCTACRFNGSRLFPRRRGHCAVHDVFCLYLKGRRRTQ
jgi:hypothetical protein